jgi:hypothetical protein
VNVLHFKKKMRNSIILFAIFCVSAVLSSNLKQRFAQLCKNPGFLGTGAFDIQKISGLWIPRILSKSQGNDDYVAKYPCLFTRYTILDKDLKIEERIYSIKKGATSNTLMMQHTFDPKAQNYWSDKVILNEAPARIFILDTDYTNYIVVYQCDSASSSLNIGVMTRKADTKLPDKIQDELSAKLSLPKALQLILPVETCKFPAY